MYWIKNKLRQIRRVIDFLPIIWKGHDFDYSYALDLFKYQLERQAKYMASDKAHTMSAKDNSRRIYTAIKLMDKVYDEEYGMEYLDKIEELYGKNIGEIEFTQYDLDKDLYGMEYKNRDEPGFDKILEVQNKLMVESREKQKRAHKLLWDYIEHNILNWWD